MKGLIKREKGITLIALVITIIVLLILAGVAISLSIGNNGLFSRAQNAANTWKKAEANEQEEMTNFESLYDETVNNLGLGGSNDTIKKDIDKIDGTETKNIETTDRNGARVVIPAGFKVDENANTVADGLVIKDVSANNADTVGNEFVWIPCTINGANGSLKYDRYAFASDSMYKSQIKLDEKDKDESYKIQHTNETSYYFHEALSKNERESVERNGGYYIGRFETGCNIPRSSSNVGNTTEVAKIKENLPVYNYVTRDEAKTIAERMYSGKSRLCSSYAWDTALKFIDGKEGTYSINSEKDNCGTQKIENTGYHAEKNIYDMGGNVSEWTREVYTRDDCPWCSSGGDYEYAPEGRPAGYRAFSLEDESYKTVGFRCTLYL